MELEERQLDPLGHPASQRVTTRTGMLAAWLAPLACGLVAVVARIPLLWDDPWAPGYDGWYYVLQTRSWMDGAPLFADRSIVFHALAALGWICDDVVVGNKIAACLFAAVGAVGASTGATRWTGSVAAGLVAGLWWASAPGHLIVSTEFLKNEAGIAIVGLVLAAIGAPRDRKTAALALGLVLLGPFVHKLTGVFGIMLGVGTLLAARSRQLPWRWVLGAAVLGGLAGSAFGLVRGVDLARFVDGATTDTPRFDALTTSARIHPVHRVSLLLAHLMPLALLVGSWRTGRLALGLPLAAIALATLAPGLPFGFDLTSWRLLLLAFVPTAFGLALLVSALPRGLSWGTVVVVAGTSLVSLGWTVPHQARPEPDYAAWAELVPVLQAHIPPDGRVVAHRGVCGFVWAVADRLCENFDPQGSADGWWRIVYGMGEDRLAPYSAVPPVRLMLGYTLVPETAWRTFRVEHGDDLPLVHHPRNPYRPRPGFVYGPQESAQ